MSILGFALVRNCSWLAACRHRGYRSWMEEALFKGLIANTIIAAFAIGIGFLIFCAAKKHDQRRVERNSES